MSTADAGYPPDDLDNTKVYARPPADHGMAFGPDGQPLQAGTTVKVEKDGSVTPQIQSHQKVELHDQGWFHAESNRYEQEELAKIHLSAISRAVVERQQAGLCNDGRWINDPHEFPDLGLTGTVTSNPVIPFPPNDKQYFISGKYMPKESHLRHTAVPNFGHNGYDSSTWMRLIDFAQHADAVHLFDEFSVKTHCGRVLQGALDNGYFVEALQAIAMRPKLVKQLFYGWNSRRSCYIARLFKHGTWMRVEVDDYVPVGRPGRDGADENVPICCRSEQFPNVLWPCLIEKAYAKIHTLRGSPGAITEEDCGGWEALNGGGKTEEALADLTGGVAGRFYTHDVSPDRLFIYIYELQRDTLFVCRPNEEICDLYGVRLNSYYPNVVNRAVQWEGGLYIQIFCGAPGVFDGGLQDITVPYGLVHCEDYPEKTEDGFFWVNHNDFSQYFKEIFECRLVNSGDVAIPNMPPPRFETVRPPPTGFGMPPGMFTPSATAGYMQQGMGPGQMEALGTSANQRVLENVSTGFLQRGVQHLAPDGTPLPWYEWIYANPGDILRSNEPEFTVTVPEHDCPCEIVCSVEQIDLRLQLKEPGRPEASPILCKVYEKVAGENYYSSQLVCRSNWIPVRDAMVAFSVNRGGEFKITAELADGKTHINKMVFRCYSSRPNVMVSASAMNRKHLLVETDELPGGSRLSLVGLMEPEGRDKDKPVYLDWEHDGMRKAEFDIEPGWTSMVKEVQEDCSVM